MAEFTHSVAQTAKNQSAADVPFFSGNAGPAFFTGTTIQSSATIQRKCAACEEEEKQEKKIQRQDAGSADQPDVITGADPAATPTPATAPDSQVAIPKHLTLGTPILVPPALPGLYNFDYSTMFHPGTEPLQFNPPESDVGKPDYFSLTQPYRFRGVGPVGDRDFSAIQSLYSRNQDFASRILGLPPDLAAKFSNTTTSIAVDNGLKGDFPTVIEKSNEGTGTHTFNAPALHFKLAVNQPNDPFEREADSMADKVIRREPADVSLDSSGVQKKCAHCEEEEKKLQRYSTSDNGGTASGALETTLETSKGKGAPMQASVNTEMSQAFGVDFSGVRVHTDDSSARMNKDLNAHAFTHGNDIYFNTGKYDPGNESGKHLLAHELTHVVQQDNGSVNRKIQRDDTGIDVDIVPVPDKENVDLHNRGIDLPESGATVPKQTQNANSGWNATANGRKTTKRAPGFTGDTDGTYISHIDVTIHANADSTVTLRWVHLGNSRNFQVPYSLRSSPGAGVCSTDCSDTANSQKDGSHCTPLSPPDYTVEGFSDYLGSYPSATFVTWYLKARGIAFHYYDIPSYPASHGCTRMDHGEDGAEWIYDNSLAGITTVTVHRDATEGPGPKCWGGGGLIDRPAPKKVKKKSAGGYVDDPAEREADAMADMIIQREDAGADTAGSQTVTKGNLDKEIEDWLTANSFQTKWGRFLQATDAYRQNMFAEEPAYMSLSAGGSAYTYLMEQERKEAIALAPDIFASLEQNDMDAYNYGMILSDRLRLIGQNEDAARAAKLYQKGWEFAQYLKPSVDAGAAGETGAPVGEDDGEGTSGTAGNTGGRGRSSGQPKQSAPVDLTQQPPPAPDDEGPKFTPVPNETVKDTSTHPLPFAGGFIAKLPGQIYVNAAENKPYLIRGTISQAIIDGKVFFGDSNFTIVQDLNVIGQRQQKYFVARLVSKGAVSDDDAQYSAADFDPKIHEKEVKRSSIDTEFGKYERKSLMVLGVILKDSFIASAETKKYFEGQVFIAESQKDTKVSPELKADIFDPIDKLQKDGKTQDAAEKLGELNESAFALLDLEKKKAYITLLTNAWTWEAQEKAIVAIFKSMDKLEDVYNIRDFLKTQQTWDHDTMWNKMIADLDSEYWSLLVEIGTKFDNKPYTLDMFLNLMREMFGQLPLFVYINEKGEPEVISGMMKEVEQAAKSALDFLQGIWDGISMLVTHPDKIVQGLGQLINLILQMQLAQMGHKPAVDYVNKTFSQIGKQVVAGFKGMGLLGAEEQVVRKVKWSLIWEVASWFVGIGEVKAALKSVEIAGVTEKILNATRIITRAVGFGKLTIEETEMAARMEKLTVLLSKESKVLKTNEEALKMMSKLSDEELANVIKALEKGEIKDDATLLELAKERPELQGLQNKLEDLEKLALTKDKSVLSESELTRLQKLITDEPDPLFEKLLQKEKTFFEKEATKPGGVRVVTDKEFAEAYDVEVKVGDHTYRRKMEDGTWCRFTTPKCGNIMDNELIDKHLPDLLLEGEPVYVEPRARGHAIERHHIDTNMGPRHEELPAWYPGVDVMEGGTETVTTIKGVKARQIMKPNVISIKSTEITDVERLRAKITKDLDVLKNKNFYNAHGPLDQRILLRDIQGKELHLIFEQGLVDAVDTKGVKALMKEMEKTAARQGATFKWFVVNARGDIKEGWSWVKLRATVE